MLLSNDERRSVDYDEWSAKLAEEANRHADHADLLNKIRMDNYLATEPNNTFLGLKPSPIDGKLYIAIIGKFASSSATRKVVALIEQHNGVVANNDLFFSKNPDLDVINLRRFGKRVFVNTFSFDYITQEQGEGLFSPSIPVEPHLRVRFDGIDDAIKCYQSGLEYFGSDLQLITLSLSDAMQILSYLKG